LGAYGTYSKLGQERKCDRHTSHTSQKVASVQGFLASRNIGHGIVSPMISCRRVDDASLGWRDAE
jgi:hypothetical protein